MAGTTYCNSAAEPAELNTVVSSGRSCRINSHQIDVRANWDANWIELALPQ